jgi:hypothetical protein
MNCFSKIPRSHKITVTRVVSEHSLRINCDLSSYITGRERSANNYALRVVKQSKTRRVRE